MIAVSALGLGVLLSASSKVFGGVKLVGASYPPWLGLGLLRTSAAPLQVHVAKVAPSLLDAFRNAGLVAMSNPKAILIFAAFFPQFADADAYWESYSTLGMVFLVLEAVTILVYATVGRIAAGWAGVRLHWFRRISGAGMIVFALTILFSDKPESAAELNFVR